MATKRKSKEMADVIQRRKIAFAELDLSEALDTIARKHRLTPTDVTEVVKNAFDSCFRWIVLKRRGI